MADQRRIYLDGTAGLPVDPRVLEAMKPYYSEKFGNPSSIHFFGREGRTALEAGRKSVADLMNAKDQKEIIFTSCATESINLAIKGLAQRNKTEGNHIVISQMEHMSVINTCKFLQKNGYEVTQVPPNKEGLTEIADLEKAIKKVA